jgi:hypothetical protein
MTEPFEALIEWGAGTVEERTCEDPHPLVTESGDLGSQKTGLVGEEGLEPSRS